MHWSHTALLALAAALFRAALAAPVPKYASADLASHYDRIHPQFLGRPSNVLDVSVNPVEARDFDIIYLYQRGKSGVEGSGKRKEKKARTNFKGGRSNSVAAAKHRNTAGVKEKCLKTWNKVVANNKDIEGEAAGMIAKYTQPLFIEGHRDTAKYHVNPANMEQHMTSTESAARAAKARDDAKQDLELGQLRLGRTVDGYPVDKHGKSLKHRKKE